MIRFPCHCGHIFELDDDSAGKLIQCPDCARLNDVPTLSELETISEDGTYKVQSPQQHEELDRLAKLQRSFSRQRVDEFGQEIDLRLQPQDLEHVGEEPPEDHPRRVTHKYDPVTGELVRPIELIDQRPTPVLPIPRHSMQYARVETAVEFGAWRIFVEMFRVPNLIVLMFVAFTHLLLQFMLFAMMWGMFLVALFAVFIAALLVSHYGYTVDETGPEEREELPRPLRDLRWHEDLWGPFANVCMAFGVSYGPALLALVLGISKEFRIALFIAGVVYGTLVFPAAALTALTSGTHLNLRPDRVLAVMVRCGGAYVLAIIVWTTASLIYAAGIIGTIMLTYKLRWVYEITLPWYAQWYFTYPALLIGMYLMHAFAWLLGLQYRRHHHEFPWVLQRYTGTRQPPAKGFPVMQQAPSASPKRVEQLD